MKRILLLLLTVIFSFIISSCGTPPGNEEELYGEETVIEIIIADKTFKAVLFDNETSEIFKSSLPVSLDMKELNGNEKYCYLSENFVVNDSFPKEIHSGDIMLYNGNCIVLFYDSFSTPYSYTPLGKILDTEGLSEAVGDGDVKVTFSLSENK